MRSERGIPVFLPDRLTLLHWHNQIWVHVSVKNPFVFKNKTHPWVIMSWITQLSPAMQSKTSSRGQLEPGLGKGRVRLGDVCVCVGGVHQYWGRQQWKEESKVGSEKDLSFVEQRIHFATWFGFKSAGTSAWHEVTLRWNFSPKFKHQLFTVNNDCISVGNYKGWIFSLRQKECDTADTSLLMCQTGWVRAVSDEGIIYVLENQRREKKRAGALF